MESFKKQAQVLSLLVLASMLPMAGYGASLSISDATVTEGDTGRTIGRINVTLSSALTKRVVVNYATSSNQATAGVDYGTKSGRLTFLPGETVKSINIPVYGDLLDEANEVVYVTLSNPVGANLVRRKGTLTINDNDPLPLVSFAVSSQTVVEGQTATATLQLSTESGLDVSVPLTISLGRLASYNDYQMRTTTPVVIPAGQTTATVSVDLTIDQPIENNETVVLTIGNPTYASKGSLNVHNIIIQDASPPAQVAKTGQTTSYVANDDGAWQKGVDSNPRFVDNGNGTVTDNRTGLIWLKNANCFGIQSWSSALNSANSLISSQCSLTDGSQVGSWRLPNVKELNSLIDYGHNGPALPVGHPFSGVQSSYYWSSSTIVDFTSLAWYVNLNDGHVHYNDKGNTNTVWPVRGGQ